MQTTATPVGFNTNAASFASAVARVEPATRSSTEEIAYPPANKLAVHVVTAKDTLPAEWSSKREKSAVDLLKISRSIAVSRRPTSTTLCTLMVAES
jgi:hypothetical protein